MCLCIIPQDNSFIPKLWETNLNNTCVEKPCSPRIKHILLVSFTWFEVCSSAHNGDWCQGFSGFAYHLKSRLILLQRKNGSGWNFSVPFSNTFHVSMGCVQFSLVVISIFLWLPLCKLPSSVILAVEKLKNLFPGLFFCP